jgi:DNA-binding CsgD family transcriptional regulator
MSTVTVTAQALQVLELLAEGLTTKQVGTRLEISRPAAAQRICRATQAIGANTRTHAVALALVSGLVSGPEPIRVEVTR